VITLVKKIFMAEAGKKPHGNKKYYHVLIDINRGELLQGRALSRILNSIKKKNE